MSERISCFSFRSKEEICNLIAANINYVTKIDFSMPHDKIVEYFIRDYSVNKFNIIKTADVRKHIEIIIAALYQIGFVYHSLVLYETDRDKYYFGDLNEVTKKLALDITRQLCDVYAQDLNRKGSDLVNWIFDNCSSWTGRRFIDGDDVDIYDCAFLSENVDFSIPHLDWVVTPTVWIDECVPKISEYIKLFMPMIGNYTSLDEKRFAVVIRAVACECFQEAKGNIKRFLGPKTKYEKK